MSEARVFRRAGRGKSASPVRRGEREAQPSGCQSLSYSTGSERKRCGSVGERGRGSVRMHRAVRRKNESGSVTTQRLTTTTEYVFTGIVKVVPACPEPASCCGAAESGEYRTACRALFVPGNRNVAWTLPTEGSLRAL